MRAMNRASIPLACLGLLSVSVAQQQLQPMDMFRLDFFMTTGAEDPVAWLDAEHYIVFDGGKNARGVSTWWRVDALSGDRERYIDKTVLLASLGDGVAAGELQSPSVWSWNEGHTHFVLNVGGDLYSSGLDGKAVRLTKTPEHEEVGVRFSPDGESVAFIANYNLHVVPTAGGEVRALTTEGHSDLFYGRLDWVYQEELYGRGNFQGYWWSPDSQQIALLKLDESPVEEFVLVSDVPARPTVERTNYPKVGEPNPVVDWRLYDTIYTERYGGMPTSNAVGYELGNVTNAAKDLHGKLMLIASAMDDNVHMQNSFQFLHALQQAQKDCDFMAYPRVRHGIGDLQQQVHLFTRFEKFLKENL